MPEVPTHICTMTGIERIAAERQRQIEAEGWTAEHDDKHSGGELALAAATYAMPVEGRQATVWMQNTDGTQLTRHLLRRILWPVEWAEHWFKPATISQQEHDGRVRELTKAGALIAAEIDRLLRLKVSS